jgi:hypothetical protein
MRASVARRSLKSLVFAPAISSPTGTPLPSQITDRFDPYL